MKRVRLKDLIELKTETISPKKNDNYFLYSLPSFDNNKNREYLKGGKIQSNKYKVPNRSILFNKLNVRFKRVWKIDNTDNNKICSTEFLPLVVDENKAYYNFCYYLLISENITNFLCNQNANTSGSHKRIDASMLLELEINLPPLETQQKIAKILSDIDDKIEVLHQINDNLAELAKTIYDYWFVQFDFPDENGKPYKTSGGKMVYNEVLKREIPEGWEVKKLGEILKKNETTIKINAKDYLSSGSIPIIDQSSDFICGYTNEISALIKASNIPAIIFGDHTRILKFIDFDFARGADGTQILFSNNEKMPQYLFYHSLLKIDLSNYGYARHFKFLKEQKILLSDRLIAEKFTDNVKTIYEKIKINRNQIQHLQSLRDWLLPMLMNGQISVE